MGADLRSRAVRSRLRAPSPSTVLATSLRRLGPVLVSLLAVTAASLLLSLPGWQAVVQALRGAGFDATRAWLISTWLASGAGAFLAAVATRRGWAAAAGGTAFVAAAFAWPWTLKTINSPPVLFGASERVSATVLLENLAVILAASFLSSAAAGGAGQLIGATAATAVRRNVSARGLAAVAVLLLVAGSLSAVAAGIDGIVRYGPSHGVYQPVVPPKRNAGPSHVLFTSFHSGSMGQDRPFAVYVPPGYSTDTERRYPVLYLLHGDPGGYRDWVNLGIQRLLDAGIASGRMPPMIAVMPEGNGKVEAAAQWANRWDGRDPVESSVLELVAFVDRHYRTTRGPGHRVIAGLSSGGFGAANLAARHPDLFSIAISLSGYFAASGPVFGTNPAFLRANSPQDIIRVDPASRRVRYVLVAGAQDGEYTAAARAFAAELAGSHVAHDLIILPGGHEGRVWTEGLALSLEGPLLPH
jgi:enterochelin esterase-like enzyme